MDEVQESDSDSSGDLQVAAVKRREVKDVLGVEGDDFDKWGTGVFYNMPEDVYHSLSAVSNTALKNARRSYRHFQYYIEGGEYLDKPKMAFGRISHRCLLEYARFKETAIFSEFENKKLKAYKDAVKANPEKVVLTLPEQKKLTGMFEELNRHPACMEYIKDGNPEVTILAIDPITKMRLKCRIDWISESKPFIVDYKTCTDAKPTVIPKELDAEKSIRSSKFERNANELGYENQGAFYLFMCELAGIPKKYFATLAQETEPPFVPCPYVYGFETIDEAMEENREGLNRLKDQILANKYPGYAETPVVLARPSYARK